LVIYTWDLKEDGLEEENFYYVLNQMLRERNPQKIIQWGGYLYYLQLAISKLPIIKTTVYRGVRINIEMIENDYTLGRTIHWTSYTSTTSNLETAKKIAKNDGSIIFFHSDIRRKRNL
jgi:hypothetical protein